MELSLNLGEIVTAFQSPGQAYSHCYDLVEYPLGADGSEQCFEKIHFAPISDIDEKELIKERELENA